MAARSRVAAVGPFVPGALIVNSSIRRPYGFGPGVVCLSAFSWSVEREVVRVLVAAGALELDLHQHVVQQRRRAEPEPIW